MAVITFVGGNDPEETERTMQIMWQIVHPKLGSNVCFVAWFLTFDMVPLFAVHFLMIVGLWETINHVVPL